MLYSRILAMGVAMGAALQAFAVGAQPDAGGHAVVEALPGDASADPSRALSAALARLGRNPRDSEALVAAGNASLALGDTEAASGFLTRADKLSPGNPAVALGLARVTLRSEDPVRAIALFDAMGPVAGQDIDVLADRGLAHDLVGDNASAQRYYHQALAMGGGPASSDEVSRRLALSLAIAGDRRGVETMLAPLLQKQDRAAWRTRAFAFAILGREEEAVAIAKATMPTELALGIAPYLRYMRRLTPAQQAAAANLGDFPHASEIGQDDPRIIAYAAAHGVRHLASADAGLVPSGTPLGTAAANPASASDTRHKRRHEPAAAPAPDADGAMADAADAAANAAPPEPAPSRVTQPAAPTHLAVAAPVPVPAPLPAPAPAPPPVPAPQPVPQPAAPASAPKPAAVAPAVRDFDLARLAAPSAAEPPASTAPSAVPTPPPALPEATPPPAPHHLSFKEAFGALGPVKADIAPAAGAVDIRKIAPARPAPKAPPPPAHPSRIWVQVGVGRDTDRMGFDWHRMTRDDPKLFRGKEPSVTPWGRTNRLLVGPFETEKAAQAYVDKLHDADHPGAFVWTSPAGQVVDPLGDQ